MKSTPPFAIPAASALLLSLLAAPVRADVLAVNLPTTPGQNTTTLPTSFHFSIDQTLKIGSPLSGSGAGSIKFGDMTWTQSNTNNLPYLERQEALVLPTPVSISSSYSNASLSTPYFRLSTQGSTSPDSYAVVDHVGLASSTGAPAVSVSAVPKTVVMSYSDGSRITTAGWDNVRNVSTSSSVALTPPGPNPNPIPAQTSVTPGGIFLRLAGYQTPQNISGTSVVPGYENWIQLSSAQIDTAARTATFSSGLTAAELSMFQDLAAGTALKQATIEFVAPGGAASSQWALNLAAFSNMTIDEANGGPLTFTETMEYGGYSEASYSTGLDGTRGPLTGFSYDGVTNVAGSIGSLTLANNVTGFGNGLFALPATGGDEGGVLDPVLAVPEPSTWAFMIAGLVAMGWAGRRRQRKEGSITGRVFGHLMPAKA